MKYNEIGKTGIKVSNLSFGASSLGGVFHDINENQAIDAVLTAVDNGINFIDVSPYYGHYKAETVLGKALRQIDRDKYYLSTKVGRYGKDGVNTWDYSAARAREARKMLIGKLSTENANRIVVAGYGDSHPIQGISPESAKNRRVEVRFVIEDSIKPVK